MGRSYRRLLGASLGVVLLLGVVAPGALALPTTPNTSFVAYRPLTTRAAGRLVLGTLSGGLYTRTKALTTGRWTNIAIGRDTMALYDKGTGKLTTGRLRAGAWKPLATTTVRKGYTDVIASCDTILFYRRSTGVGLVAELTAGGMRDKREVALTPGITLLQASCDTLLGITPGATSVWTLGLLANGAYTATPTKEYLITYDRLATNTDSFLAIDADGTAPDYGFWGILQAGSRLYAGESPSFGVWRIIAGAADSIVFYQPSYGTALTATLTGGALGTQTPTADAFAPGFSIMAGGR